MVSMEFDLVYQSFDECQVKKYNSYDSYTSFGSYEIFSSESLQACSSSSQAIDMSLSETNHDCVVGWIENERKRLFSILNFPQAFSLLRHAADSEYIIRISQRCKIL